MYVFSQEANIRVPGEHYVCDPPLNPPTSTLSRLGIYVTLRHLVKLSELDPPKSDIACTLNPRASLSNAK